MMDDQLERNVLGCILSGADIPPVLEVGMFTSPRNRTVFKALTAMTEQGKRPGPCNADPLSAIHRET
jgi:replicative DNA helicase